jgi:hypothetical protein
MKDPTSLGKITLNYYDYDNNFIANQWVDIPSWLHIHNESLEDRLRFNDYKPDDFHLDGMLDLDTDISFENMSLWEIKELGSANIYYKLKTFTKTVEYYQDNVRIGSKDLFISLSDIENAETLEDLGIEKDLYYTEDFAHGRIIFDENIIKSHNLKDFIDAPSPIVVYDKLTKEEAPNKFYVSYYRGGAYDDERIQYNPEDPNYLTCDLDAVVLNPNGAIKYLNHYHSALYEDETFDYFIPYQVKVINKFSGIHKGPGRKYQTLAMIIEKDTYTIVEERNGWGRLKEYQRGWIDLNATEPMYGPGQNPEYDTPDAQTATLPFATRFHITKLTIDRLWAYSPEIESWIKTEEISFDQAGKLYNGLDIKVIDLSAIDFTTVASLADMGIYPQAKKLQYHEFADETYNGEFTLEAFQNLHELEFVYPETIYNLNCIYYKDKVEDDNELGRAGFSYSLSDWNPDWDTFIETSYRLDEYGNEIPPTIYRDTELVLNWDFYNINRNLFKPEGSPDGIYLWNPRTWDIHNEKFTFTEIIGVGTQKVLYPNIDVGKFKVIKTENYVEQTSDRVDLFPVQKFYIQESDIPEAQFIYDINIEAETGADPNGKYISSDKKPVIVREYSTDDYSHLFSYQTQFMGMWAQWLENKYIPSLHGILNSTYWTTRGTADEYGDMELTVPGNKYISKNDIVNYNFSNKRTNGQVIIGIQYRNDLNNINYYSYDNNKNLISIKDNTNIKLLKNRFLAQDYRPPYANNDAEWFKEHPAYRDLRYIELENNGAPFRGAQFYVNYEL